ISGDSSILLVKSALDGVSSIVLAASMGVGVLFSSLVVLIYQGGISLLSGLLQPVLMTGNLMSQLCMVGYGIIIAIGINFVATTRIKTLNMLPALLVPPIWMAIKSIIGMF
ncbi:MAG: DUF554 family protein, partial [Lachnospiraceae bacterium]|nr:DUF554 family protein [Candidatus Equihabitans merdae]